MPTSCPESNLLAAFVDGFIGDRQRQEIERHLDACADCRLAVADIARRTDGGPLDPFVPLVPGARVGRYRIVDRLGAGGMGEVYRARDEALDRDIAIKLLRRTTRTDGAAESRLRREARAMARTSHPNVLPVYDVGVHEGATYIAMQLVDGETLADRIAAGIAWTDALGVLLAAAEGLAAAHRVGVVHRDFKPANVFVAATGDVFVGDFGLAGDDAYSRSSGAFAALDAEDLTRSGLTMGTPAYMAPEQHAAMAIDARADEYALCVCLYEALYGVRPFHASTIDELHRAKRLGPPAPARGVAPRWLWPVIRRGLQPDPADRWPSIDALVGALRRGRHRNLRAWVGAALVVGSAAGAAWLSLDDDEDRCESARARMQAIWGGEQRTRVGGAFGGDPMLGASAVLALDAYAEDWNEAHAIACRRTESPSVAACLDEALGGLEAVIALVAEASDSEGAAALTSIGLLSSPRDCLGEGRDAASPGEVPIRLLVGKAKVLARAGKFEEALAACESASALAREVGTAGVLAETEVLRGSLLRSLGEGERARDPLRFGYELAVLTGRWAAAAEAATGLVGEHATSLDDMDGALRWAAMAEAALGEVDDPALRGRFECTLGASLIDHGRGDEALERLHRGLELSVDDTVGRARCRVNIAIAYERLGRYEEAEREVTLGLQGFESAYGLAHRQVGKVLLVRANIARERGDLPMARELYGRALAISLEAVGEDHEQTANVLENLANVQTGAEVLATARRALEIRRRLTPSGSLRLARSLEQVAALEMFAENFDAAEPLAEEAFAMKEQIVGRDHIVMAKSHQLLTHVYAHTNRMDLAFEQARRGTELARIVYPPGHPELGRAMLVEGEILRGTERNAEAVPLVAEAIAIAEASDPILLVDALVTDGLLRHELGDLPGSIAALERAVVLADAGTPPTRGRPRLLMSLARSLLDGGGDRKRAAALAQQARDELAQSSREGDETRVEIDRLIAAATAPR